MSVATSLTSSGATVPARLRGAPAQPGASGSSTSSVSAQRFVLWLAAALLAVILLVSFFAPATADDDPRPTTYNNGSAGIKAAFLLLGDLGYAPARWEESTDKLGSVDAAHTTLVLADPTVPPAVADDVQGDIEGFLNRGGRVLATGTEGAYLIPGAHTATPTGIYNKLCLTTPEGQGPLARAGSVSIAEETRWQDDSAATRVQQRCGSDAVVVSAKVGRGEAVWWSSPMPMTNRGLKEDASLKLMLASIGPPGRRILFDEALHGEEQSVWETAKGLPLRSLLLQLGAVAVLLVLSFGRRNGPVRLPARATRSSPLEFAESMGHLYHKAGATQVATDGARRRLLRFLHERCGVPQAILRSGPAEVVATLQARFGGEWPAVGEHLKQSESDAERLSPGSALKLVKAMDKDVEMLSERVKLKR